METIEEIFDDKDNIVSEDEYRRASKRLRWKTRLNSYILAIAIIIGGLSFIPLVNNTSELYEKISGIEEMKVTNTEIAQIASDEGYRSCAYKDSLGLRTIGFGTLVEGLDTPKCINPHQAVLLLREHYEIAKASVQNKYPWAEGKEQLVLINLSYNMGETRLAKFKKTLKYLQEKKYDSAAGELLDSRYAKQVPSRAGRMAGRIMAIGG